MKGRIIVRFIALATVLISFYGCGLTDLACDFGKYAEANKRYAEQVWLEGKLGIPDNIIKIDNNGSEVWEYYNNPTTGQVSMHAFVKGKLKDSGLRDMNVYLQRFGEKATDNNFLRERYIQIWPVYESFRNKKSLAKSETELPPQTGAKTPTLSPSSLREIPTMSLY